MVIIHLMFVVLRKFKLLLCFVESWASIFNIVQEICWWHSSFSSFSLINTDEIESTKKISLVWFFRVIGPVHRWILFKIKFGLIFLLVEVNQFCIDCQGCEFFKFQRAIFLNPKYYMNSSIHRAQRVWRIYKRKFQNKL